MLPLSLPPLSYMILSPTIGLNLLAYEYVLPVVREMFKGYLLPRTPLWSFRFEIYSDRLEVGAHRAWWLEYVSAWRSWWRDPAAACSVGAAGLVCALHVLHERRAHYARRLLFGVLVLPRWAPPTLLLELLIVGLLVPSFSISGMSLAPLFSPLSTHLMRLTSPTTLLHAASVAGVLVGLVLSSWPLAGVHEWPLDLWVGVVRTVGRVLFWPCARCCRRRIGDRDGCGHRDPRDEDHDRRCHSRLINAPLPPGPQANDHPHAAGDARPQLRWPAQ